MKKDRRGIKTKKCKSYKYGWHVDKLAAYACTMTTTSRCVIMGIIKTERTMNALHQVNNPRVSPNVKV